MKVDELARKKYFKFPEGEKRPDDQVQEGDTISLSLLDKNDRPCKISGMVDLVSTYPASRVLQIRTCLGGVPYVGDVIINNTQSQLDGVVLKYDYEAKA